MFVGNITTNMQSSQSVPNTGTNLDTNLTDLTSYLIGKLDAKIGTDVSDQSVFESSSELTLKPRLKLNIIDPSKQIDNTWSILKVARERPPQTWEGVFRDADPELEDIDEILETDRNINSRWYPDNINLFRAFENTNLTNVNVVIMGQDPYPSLNPDGTPQAQGFSFSVKRGVKIPSSLRNIYKELKRSVPTFQTPRHGDLTHWTRQGVLLLNSCLTVRHKSPGCHGEIWLGFVKKVIKAIININDQCIFVLWGKKAQKLNKMLGGANILESSHPSGLSAHRGFIGCDHFVTINEMLEKQGKTPIDWNVY